MKYNIGDIIKYKHNNIKMIVQECYTDYNGY